VLQNGSRQRTFTYDLLSRLLTASNPESGTITYSYDANGNLTSKTSPAPNQTGSATVTVAYCYDALNRPTSRAYTTSSACPQTSPVATYLYDQSTYNGLTITNGIGRRTGMTDLAGAEAWSYDSMGRILTDSRTTNGVNHTFPYTYNLDGSIKTINYGNYNGSETVSFVQGGAGRALSETGVQNWVSSAHYAPSGGLCSLSTWGDNGVENISFNNRFQPVHIHETHTPCGGNSAPPPCQPPTWAAGWVDLTYSYTDANGHNNGNVFSITDHTVGAKSQNFTYDSLNRLATAQTTGTHASDPNLCWAETYNYDPWANLLELGANTLTQSAYIGCSQESGFDYSNSVNTKNQISFTGFTYDAAGNLMTPPGLGTVTFNAENQLVSAAGVTYTYDGDGKRVMKFSGTIYWYGLNDAPLVETPLTGTGISTGELRIALISLTGPWGTSTS
jgi:YD repeat-containing protein